MTVSEAEISIITDQAANTGIGRYAMGIYGLLKGDFPNLRLVQLTHMGGNTIPMAVTPKCVKPANSFVSFPIRKFKNLKRLKSEAIFSDSNIHLCGSDYSLTSVTENSVCTVHDYFYRIPSFGAMRNMKELASEIYIDYYNLLTPKHIKRSCGIIVNSQSVHNDICKKTGLESQVIHIWTEDQFKPRDRAQAVKILGLPAAKKYLLNVSGAGANKNLPTLERLANMLPPEFVIVKVGHPLQHPRVLNVGRVSDEDYPLYFNVADFYVNTSTREGFCIPLIESMSSGLPVVTPRLPPFDEILSDSGIYVKDPFDEADYLARIIAISDQDTRSEISKRAIDRTAKFSKSSAREAILKVYQHCFKL